MQGLGVVHITGLDLDQAQVGDLAIHVSHSNFYSKVHVWLKTSDGTRSWMTIARHQIFLKIPSLFNPLNIELHKRNEIIPKIGDIWIPILVISPHHKVRFSFLELMNCLLSRIR